MDTLMRLFFYICFFSYVLYSRSVIKKHMQLNNKLTAVESKYLSWVRILIFFLIPTLIMWLMNGILLLYGYKYSHVYVLMHVLISIVVFLSGYSILMNPEVLYHAKPVNHIKKYFASSLSKQDGEFYLQEIINLMEKEELYLDPDFDLMSLANKIGLPRNHLSQIMNENYGRSFNEFINSYRVRKVKEHLQNPSQRNLTILNIAFNAGFNSKATFNKVFKDYVGMAPSVFRKKKLMGQDA